MLKVHVITLFPESFLPLNHSICGRAQEQGFFKLDLIHLRDFAINKYGTVDDYPFGGEAGMVLRPEPLAAAIRHAIQDNPQQEVIYLSADAPTWTQNKAKTFALDSEFTLVCGHYKGIDERIRQTLITQEVSIGDFVLTGGELPAMIMLDSIVRLLPGVLGDEQAAFTDSFWENKLGWPVYTRPAEWEGQKVPPILLSGHHAKIKKWQEEQSIQRTIDRRPDLLNNV